MNSENIEDENNILQAIMKKIVILIKILSDKFNVEIQEKYECKKKKNLLKKTQ